MKKLTLILFTAMLANSAQAQDGFESDIFSVEGGTLRITFISHGTLMLQWNDLVLHVDPVGAEADYSKLPKADLVLVTHEHRDHLDAKAIETIRKPNTVIVLNGRSYEQLKEGIVMKNGDTQSLLGVKIEAVPAYNTTEGRDQFHPRGRDNGYILTIGGKRVYIAGDTEDIPEMKQLRNIDIAFLPMNQPYTMTPRQAASAARAFKPKILYPYHYGETDASELARLLKDSPEIEVRVRKLD